MSCATPNCNGVTMPRSKYCSAKCRSNFSKRNYKARNKNNPEYQEKKRLQALKDRATPHGAYTCHKHRAKQSGIPFNFTFAEWWLLWKPHWEERGLGNLVMCRKEDQGAYELGNVRIDSQANNNREAHELRRNL